MSFEVLVLDSSFDFFKLLLMDKTIFRILQNFHFFFQSSDQWVEPK